MTYNTPGAYHMQYGVCHVVRRDTWAIKLDRTEIAPTLPLFRWLKSLTEEDRRKPEARCLPLSESEKSEMLT